MKFIKFILIFLSFIFLCKETLAQEVKLKFQDWRVIKENRGDQELCYMISTAIKSEGNYDSRGEAFFVVTDIINDADEISVSSGFYYNKNSDVEISFGSKKFYLFPYKGLAFANDKSNDIDIIKEMQKHPDMLISGVSNKGKIANDTYSLIGFSQAYKKMKEICK